ncbi:MAG: YqgE/AlgH family protein [Saccharospirillum sp.]
MTAPLTSAEAGLSHQFIVAMPSMQDPWFNGTVSYLFQHDNEGTMGLVINRLTSMKLGEVFDSLDIDCDDEDLRDTNVYSGGPVMPEHGFIIHRSKEGPWSSTANNGYLSITTSPDILEAIAKGRGPTDFLVCLGCSGWSPGQLEGELKGNAWLTVPADLELIFEEGIETRYDAALKRLGIDKMFLSDIGGQA